MKAEKTAITRFQCHNTSDQLGEHCLSSGTTTIGNIQIHKSVQIRTELPRLMRI